MKNENLKKISDAVGGIMISDTNDYVCASKLISSIGNKDLYFLSIGQHSAVVRRNGDRYEFLEMQQSRNNKWFTLDNSALRDRFKAVKKNVEKGVESINYGFLMSFDDLRNNERFEYILQFINTYNLKKKK